MNSKKIVFDYMNFKRNSWNEIVEEKKYVAETELEIDIITFCLSAYSTVTSFASSNNYAWKVPSVIIFILVTVFRLSIRHTIYVRLSQNKEHLGMKILAHILKSLCVICILYVLIFVYFLFRIHFKNFNELFSTFDGIVFLSGCVCVFLAGVLDKVTWFLLKPKEV